MNTTTSEFHFAPTKEMIDLHKKNPAKILWTVDTIEFVDEFSDKACLENGYRYDYPFGRFQGVEMEINLFYQYAGVKFPKNHTVIYHAKKNKTYLKNSSCIFEGDWLSGEDLQAVLDLYRIFLIQVKKTVVDELLSSKLFRSSMDKTPDRWKYETEQALSDLLKTVKVNTQLNTDESGVIEI